MTPCFTNRVAGVPYVGERIPGARTISCYVLTTTTKLEKFVDCCVMSVTTDSVGFKMTQSY